MERPDLVRRASPRRSPPSPSSSPAAARSSPMPATTGSSGHGRDRPRLRTGDHGHGLRDRPPLRRPHQPRGHNRLRAHPAFPRPRGCRLHRRPMRRCDRRRLLLLAVWPDQPAQLGATVPSIGLGSALVYEAILTRLPDVRDHGRRHRHPRGRRRRGDRNRRHGRPRRALRRAGHRRLDEPGTEPRPGARQRHVDRLLDLHRRPRRRGSARRSRLPAGPRGAPVWPKEPG